jgi:hypothetical protein
VVPTQARATSGNVAHCWQLECRDALTQNSTAWEGPAFIGVSGGAFLAKGPKRELSFPLRVQHRNHYMSVSQNHSKH